MIEIFKSATSNDFAQRYSNSYGWCDIAGKRTLVQIRDVSDKWAVVADQDGRVHEFEADAGFKFEFVPTQRGWYNTTNTLYPVVLVTRNPQRQWARGINQNNTNIVDHRIRRVGLGFGILSAINWSKWEVQPKEGTPVALSRQFMLAGTGSLYFYNRQVGDYKPKSKTLAVNELVLQEVKDLVSRNSLPFVVEQQETPPPPLMVAPRGVRPNLNTRATININWDADPFLTEGLENHT